MSILNYQVTNGFSTPTVSLPTQNISNFIDITQFNQTTALILTGAGDAGDNPKFTLCENNQPSVDYATKAKAIGDYLLKEDDSDLGDAKTFTKVTQAYADNLTFTDNSKVRQAFFDIDKTQLKPDTTHIYVSISGVSNASKGILLFFSDPKYKQEINVTALSEEE